MTTIAFTPGAFREFIGNIFEAKEFDPSGTESEAMSRLSCSPINFGNEDLQHFFPTIILMAIREVVRELMSQRRSKAIRNPDNRETGDHTNDETPSHIVADNSDIGDQSSSETHFPRVAEESELGGQSGVDTHENHAPKRPFAPPSELTTLGLINQGQRELTGLLAVQLEGQGKRLGEYTGLELQDYGQAMIKGGITNYARGKWYCRVAGLMKDKRNQIANELRNADLLRLIRQTEQAVKMLPGEEFREARV